MHFEISLPQDYEAERVEYDPVQRVIRVVPTFLSQKAMPLLLKIAQTIEVEGQPPQRQVFGVQVSGCSGKLHWIALSKRASNKIKPYVEKMSAATAAAKSPPTVRTTGTPDQSTTAGAGTGRSDRDDGHAQS